MAIQKVHIFQNYNLALEDIKDPETGDLAGKTLIMTDPDSGGVYQFPMNLDNCKLVGQQLMGIGGIKPATAAEAAAITSMKNGKGR